MPFTISEWVNLATIISAITDVLTLGRGTYEFYYRRRLSSPAMVDKARFLEKAFSTYSDAELESVKRRIESCRDRFIKEGSGPQRRQWKNTYEQLRCDKP
jgi:hypothetical protein